ncbi:Uncharacterised protein [BD1-7 clade bacterium]|uniref:PhoPQ-activated pathogenicity-related protein n=1 Tax=BD1-7 clade bacterium TaxID=2029982 RepID=A0A5S9PHQ8_9GAMM|nr:Uncharacterised protein [BD1-7 clade bacterium]
MFNRYRRTQMWKALLLTTVITSLLGVGGCGLSDDSSDDDTSGPSGDSINASCILPANSDPTAIFDNVPTLDADEITPLDRYIAEVDPSTKIEFLNKKERTLGTVYNYLFTSQDWKQGKTQTTIQTHMLSIYINRLSRHNTGIFLIVGGSNPVSEDGLEIPSLYQNLLALVPASSIAVLGQVPNQPAVFLDDPEQKPRQEDTLLAYTWRKVADGFPVERAGRFPMTKAAILAMEEVIKITEKLESEKKASKTTKFVVAGASKRGWTTWTAAAFDQGPLGKNRIAGIIPIVITQNIPTVVANQYCSLNTYSYALEPYAEQNVIPELIYSDKYTKLFESVDPFAYRSRYCNIPKMLINATGDQFINIDWTRYYLSDLPGDNYFRVYPNIDHTLKNGEKDLLVQDFLPFFSAIALPDSIKQPNFSWEFLDDGTIIARTKDKPTSGKIWSANNTDARDFRLSTIGDDGFTDRKIEYVKTGDTYEYRVTPPQNNGWTASFIEVKFKSGHTLTTEVQVWPRMYPFPNQNGFTCPVAQ